MTSPLRPLYQFAFIPSIDDKLEQLAKLAEPEDWDYKVAPSRHPVPVLHNYIHQTFIRVQAEDKIAYSTDNRFACFNTGLVTNNQEAIFMVFEENNYEDAPNPWRYFRFCRKGEQDMNRFSLLLDLAHYFDDPAQLVFDHRVELRVNVEHIISDNRERFPEPYRSMDSYVLQTLVKGVIDNAVERVKRNYKAAIPQYYQGRIQLLLPLCLSHPQRADLAMVVEKFPTFYRASTCLTLDMAYNNARQLARPDRDWLQP